MGKHKNPLHEQAARQRFYQGEGSPQREIRREEMKEDDQTGTIRIQEVVEDEKKEQQTV